MNASDQLSEALRWLRWAHEDLAWAEHGLAQSSLVPRPACGHAQQAAEKALKAALIASGITFPYRHNLNVLPNLLPDDWRVKYQYPDLSELTVWNIESRYPGDLPEPTTADAQRAIGEAKGIVASIQTQLRERNPEREL